MLGARAEQIRPFVEHNLTRGDDGRLRWRFDARGLVGSLVTITGAGHDITQEQPAQVARAVLDYLAGA